MSVWFGWATLYVDDDGMPVDRETSWVASCFVLFTHVVWVGTVRSARGRK